MNTLMTMEMQIEEVESLSFAGEGPTTLAELLAVGKKVSPEATSLLMQDHAEVSAKFNQFQAEDDSAASTALANVICMALTVHAQIEEEIFYPLAGAALEDDDIVTEAVEEHAEMKEQIGKVVEGLAETKSVGPQLAKLMRLVQHHVEEEETGMFPDIQRTETDLYALGAALATWRLEALLQLRRQAVAAVTQS
jgi:hypothetical protein